jgi:preprotein translocase subunit SecA
MSTAAKSDVNKETAVPPTPPAPESESPQNLEELSVWEKIGDFFTALQERVMDFLTRLFGSSNERFIRQTGYTRVKDADPPYAITPGSILDQINKFEPQMAVLSDADLKGITPKLRERLANGETLNQLLPEAFAACREAGKRFKNMRHFDVQMLGGLVLHQGKIAEMATGEGKTLVATLPAYLNCLTRHGVHVVTVNDYLARRDCEWMTPIYQGLGITAGFIQADMDPGFRREAYDCDITYGTNSEFGFDYLRDNMKPARWGDAHYPPWQHQCQKELNFAIIDEVDNILIDEARTPLIISGSAHGDIERFRKADKVARQLKAGVHFEIKEKEHTCHLTETGIHEAERLAGVESFYTAGNMEWPHLIDQALKAHNLYKKDKQYMIMPDRDSGKPAIIIIDEFTGRPMWGRQWSDGLHQAVEAKENVPVKEETQTLATVTLQNFFKLYKKLAGMTGTAMTEANEFWKIYKLEVVNIPTNRRLKRVNQSDLVYRTEREKWNAIVDEIANVHKEGRPILVGTTDVAKSEKLNEMLKRRGIKCELLNAKPEYVAKESEIIAQAGRLGAVTISTNMAGRGTDIILGGNPEFMAWSKLRHQFVTRLEVPPDVWKTTVDEIEAKEKTKEEGRKVAEMGGLHVVGTERHEARRIDNQLRGRSGRQGDPGSSRFYLSLQDDLMRIFGGEWMSSFFGKLGMEEGESIESKMLSRRIEGCQKKVEEKNFDIRKNLLEYDEVMDHQRKRTYGYRQNILDGDNCQLLVRDMLDAQTEKQISICLSEDYGPDSFAKFASLRLPAEFEGSDFRRADFEQAANNAKERAARTAVEDIESALEENLPPEVEEKAEWNWQALAAFMNSRYGQKLSDRDLKKVDRDKLHEFLLPKAEAYIEQVDLSEGKPLLELDYGRKSLAGWAQSKFGMKIAPEEFANKRQDEILRLFRDRFDAMYAEKDIDFPVAFGLMTFMAEHRMQGVHMQKYDREGLLNWAKGRFPGVEFKDEEFLTQSRSRLKEIVTEASRKFYPTGGLHRLDEEVDRHFGRQAKLSDESANELSAFTVSQFQLSVKAEELKGQNEHVARMLLHNAFDARYRQEIRTAERSLLLNTLDAQWKDHLYTMDQLRSGVGLIGLGQAGDPRTEYKRQGMKAFDEMWDTLQVKLTDVIFRMEESPESYAEAMFQNSIALHSSSASMSQLAEQAQAQQQEQQRGNTGEAPKKVEPIRNRGPKVGRNDPCPCGSGKKHKNCCMKK